MKTYDLDFDFRDARNLSLTMDFYELTMAQVYFSLGMRDEIVTFDMFYRRNPDKGGFALFAGLEQLIGYIQNLCFTDDDIDFLRKQGKFTEDFLDYLRHFIFTGDIYAVKEGTPVFPNEPLLRIRAKQVEAQIIETALLLAINHQTLIATKANRVVRAAKGRVVMEFGARRAHNFDAANFGARAAYIGGVQASATTSAGRDYGVPVTGTMAHSFVQSFESEYEAFLAYAKIYPDSCTVLVDTYDTLRSGIKNAIRVHKEYLEPRGHKLAGVRIDSGDIAYLSKKIREELDANGMYDTKIVASNSFDEYLIKSIIEQGAQIDSFGVGENLICSKSTPVFGGVYKLSSVYKDGTYIPKIKISENVEKLTNPGFKNLYRIYEKETGKAAGDVMTLYNEEIHEDMDLTIYHPSNPWKYKTFEKGTFILRDMLNPIFVDGKLVYDAPSIEEIKVYSKKELDTLWPEIFRFEYPQEYFVDLSKNLLDLKLSMLEDIKKKTNKK